jgi:IS5 family transposase
LQFIVLSESRSIKDARTIVLLRLRLAQVGASTLVFNLVEQQLWQYGCVAHWG